MGQRVTHVLPSELEANERLASMSKLFRESGADDPVRTGDLLITNQFLVTVPAIP